MWVGKNNLCAGGMLSATIEYNVLQLGEVADLEALTFNLALNPPFCQTAVSGWHFL